jgi:hypothetical protein
MADNIKVRTIGELASMTHPSGAVATKDGGSWPNDQFTARRLLDKDIEEIKEDEARPPVETKDEAPPAKTKKD